MEMPLEFCSTLLFAVLALFGCHCFVLLSRCWGREIESRLAVAVRHMCCCTCTILLSLQSLLGVIWVSHTSAWLWHCSVCLSKSLGGALLVRYSITECVRKMCCCQSRGIGMKRKILIICCNEFYFSLKKLCGSFGVFMVTRACWN